ncbi:MAG: sigma-70 family RNA polymerase sigma factor [Planctomycetota bacterium]|nr:sigma-70 family RNA polymerase sigma factor [Planctomycetota bacterium]
MISSNSPLGRLRQRQRVLVQPGRGLTSRGSGLTSEEEQQLHRILADPMDYIDSEEFTRPDAEDCIYDKAPVIERPDVSWYRPLMDEPEPNRQQTPRNPGTVLLTAAQERVLFLQYNYARHRVRQMQMEIGPNEPTEQQAGDLLRWYSTATRYREQIAETNLALVLAMAKRTRMSEVDFADLVSEGNMALLRSVDKFDCGRGFKFSTYACRAILKAFSRQGMKLTKYRQRFPTDFDPAMEKSNHLEVVRRGRELDAAEEVKHIVVSNEAELTNVEKTVVYHRFGLDAEQDNDPMTLEQVGQIIGVTKERVRQIQNKALEKIRLTVEENAKRRNGESEEEDDGPTPSDN